MFEAAIIISSFWEAESGLESLLHVYISQGEELEVDRLVLVKSRGRDLFETLSDLAMQLRGKLEDMTPAGYIVLPSEGIFSSKIFRRHLKADYETEVDENECASTKWAPDLVPPDFWEEWDRWCDEQGHIRFSFDEFEVIFRLHH